ncbi:MAG: family 43 glycosylhydrolase [Tidjanibacter sp.]|nr:family 43 glycosylhydrolase [Tidjanibacter sp.]
MKKIFLLCVALLVTVGNLSAQPAGTQRRSMNTIRKVELKDISMSDPYILADPQTKMYYMTGTGGRLWKSADLKTWEGPYAVAETDPTSWMGERPAIWAAEIHYYEGKYYFFGTFTNDKIIIEDIPNRYKIPRRASHVLVADKAEGPYRPMSNEPYTDEKLATLDGTLWVENGTPYMIYCHEWLQCVDGTMDMIKLTKDLSASKGKAKTMFKASEGPWSREMNYLGELTYGLPLGGQVTDGPFLFKTQTGKLGMLWSSWSEKRYTQGVAYSASGKLRGPWIHEQEPLNTGNQGHGMMFRTFEGKLLMCLHYQDEGAPRKPRLMEVDDSGDKIRIIGEYIPR